MQMALDLNEGAGRETATGGACPVERVVIDLLAIPTYQQLAKHIGGDFIDDSAIITSAINDVLSECDEVQYDRADLMHMLNHLFLQGSIERRTTYGEEIYDGSRRESHAYRLCQ